ncbi:MAG: glycosyltransferase family 8 protein [Clostridia bacterium]|nr:glycosyltransferase family 8 protein [Clostridia bacterium]
MKKNILCAINKGYIKHFLAMINSLSDNNKESDFDVYVMHTNLDDQDKAYMESIVPENIKLSYIYMDNSLFKGAPKVKRYPYEIYYRIFAPGLLPESVDRILYLDSDLIVHNNIDDLYNTDFKGNLFVACTQIKGFLQWFNRVRLTVGKNYYYMNTGVMVMNISELRKVIDTDKIFKFIKHNGWRMTLYDQDVLCKFFGNRILLVDRNKYNLADRHIRAYNRKHKKNPMDLEWVDKNNVIVHYLGTNKPWKDNYRGILKDYYQRYKIK